MIRQLARAGRLDLNAGLFKLLKIKPRGQVIDDRIWQITIRNLLDHKAGWQGEPFDRAVQAARDHGYADPIPLEVLLGFLMTQRLKHTPGSKFEYCNFCFDTLRHVAEKVSGRKPAEYLRQELFRPFGMKELRGFVAPGDPVRKDGPVLVWNADGGGPVSASAPALCAFMRYFWLTGERRDKGNPLWRMHGSLPNSTACMLWRSDGIDVAFLFNGRGQASHDDIVRDLENVIESLKQ
jgi:CubicO group peptidase (beta-lactamase class C family)